LLDGEVVNAAGHAQAGDGGGSQGSDICRGTAGFIHVERIANHHRINDRPIAVDRQQSPDSIDRAAAAGIR